MYNIYVFKKQANDSIGVTDLNVKLKPKEVTHWPV